MARRFSWMLLFAFCVIGIQGSSLVPIALAQSSNCSVNDPNYADQKRDYEKIGLGQCEIKTKTVVVVIDGPIGYHPDLNNNRLFLPDFQVGPSDVPGDDHATMVAGVSNAVSNNGIGVRGVVKGRFISIPISGPNGFSIPDAISLAVKIKKTYGLNMVIVTPFVVPGYNQDILEAMRLAKANAILFVCSAGNDGVDLRISNPPILPAAASRFDSSIDNVISVAGVEFAPGGWVVSSFSNVGADIAAPDHFVWSTKADGTYGPNSGTSFAAPFVAAAAANKMDQYGGDYHLAKQDILSNVGSIAPSEVGKILSGGMLDVSKLNLRDPINSPPLLTNNTFTVSGGAVTLTAVDSDNDLLNFRIDFGNGNVVYSGSPVVRVPYSQPGQYQATVTVTDGVDETSSQVTIIVPQNQKPVINSVNLLDKIPEDIAGTATNFSATATPGSGKIVNFDCRVDQAGRSLIFSSPNGQFQIPFVLGQATVTIVAKDDSGLLSDPFVKKVSVTDRITVKKSNFDGSSLKVKARSSRTESVLFVQIGTSMLAMNKKANGFYVLNLSTPTAPSMVVIISQPYDAELKSPVSR